jgi:hypothetical protein
MTDPDPETLRAAADERVRQQIQAAANKRTSRKAKRAQLIAARSAGLRTRHRQKLTQLDNATPAATAA